ncbi:cupin domain-containing protein [Telmatospirillum siberiense]|uniref:Aldehyde dehydrogenase n=1 Tax=Telmatospirillum siberiense TaxID=382514 RepID=A0A2N3PVL7_9PROT|nr:cupin domain-containing protein [Telmatospirillum siberiense]PKU24444.1 aldehyde dehydrogenase [Telmatospirillum siberiense]
MDIDVGARLKAVRQRLHLSQRELARRAGITNASISLIESNRLNPSVGALKRVLDGIPMGLAEFFAMEMETPPQVFYGSADFVEIVSGDISYRQVGRDLTGRALQIMLERYVAGADTGRVPLSHDGEEGGVVIAGRLEVTVGDQMRVLGPGEAYYFHSRTPHRFRNVGREDCRVISACTPPSF